LPIAPKELRLGEIVLQDGEWVRQEQGIEDEKIPAPMDYHYPPNKDYQTQSD
jgi:hypothetical protein